MNTKTDQNNSLPENGSRRKAVKTIVSGVTAIAVYNAFPVKWNKPIVESIFLPAHAATSGTSLHDPCSLSIISGSRNTNEVVIQINGYVVPATANLPTTIVAMPEGTGNTVTETTKTLSDGTFTAILTITGGPSISRINVTTTVMGAAGSATCALDLNGGSGNTGQPKDSDGDGVPDSSDVCNGYDDNVDSDADGVPDGCDVCNGSDDNEDDDNDGIPDGCDNITPTGGFSIGDAYTQTVIIDYNYLHDPSNILVDLIYPGYEVRYQYPDNDFIRLVVVRTSPHLFTDGQGLDFLLIHTPSRQTNTVTVTAQVS